MQMFDCRYSSYVFIIGIFLPFIGIMISAVFLFQGELQLLWIPCICGGIMVISLCICCVLCYRETQAMINAANVQYQASGGEHGLTLMPPQPIPTSCKSNFCTVLFRTKFMTLVADIYGNKAINDYKYF